MTLESLESEQGYAHVSEIRHLEQKALVCNVCNLLKLALFKSARSLDPTNEIRDLDRALDLLSPRIEEQGFTLKTPCPIILALEPGVAGLLRPDRLHIGIRPMSRCGITSFTDTTSGVIDPSLAYLLLHGEPDPIPLFPRLGSSALFHRFNEVLWAPPRTPLQRMLPRLLQPPDQCSWECALPTRVLDLGHPSKGKPVYLNDNLHLTEASDRHGRWATLSYCWGTYRGFMTEQASYEERCRSIKFGDLPKLFQQAVEVTRRLRISYLWIDALCIVQDQRDDWTMEMSQMAHIYGKCHVRIAATAARDPTQSFYPPKPIVTSVRPSHLDSPLAARAARDPTRSFYAKPHSRLKYSREDGENNSRGEDEGKNRSKRCCVTLPKSYAEDIDVAHLNTRAWVLQERLLSPNTIHFCEDHIYIETDYGISGEDGIWTPRGWKTCIWTFGAGRARLMQLRQEGNYSDQSDASDAWLRIAELYSDCKMTYPMDKLSAIAGLLEDRRNRGKFPYLGSKYFLGMWQITLHEDLLWVRKGSQGLKLLESANLPSWTWFAYDNAVVFLKDRRTLRNRSTCFTAPVAEFEVVKITGPYETMELPLQSKVSMVLRLNMAQISSIGPKKARITEAHNDKETCQSSPFRYDLGTYNRPILLNKWTDYFEILDNHSGLVGYISMDDATDVPPTTGLWCAHIATLHDETYKGPNPLSRYKYAFAVDEISALYTSGLGKDYRHSEESHILAYCLILRSTGTAVDEYCRVGIAEIKYEWIRQAPKATISLV